MTFETFSASGLLRFCFVFWESVQRQQDTETDSERDFARLRPGDVLVCKIATPAWSALFGIAGAVVTDLGSPLSHTAIVAREHGVPAIVATGCATEKLRDGELVTVDGTRGTRGTVTVESIPGSQLDRSPEHDGREIRNQALGF